MDAETIRTLRSLGNAPGSGKHLSAKSKKRPAKSSRPNVQEAHLEETTASGPRRSRRWWRIPLDGIVIMGPKLEVLYQNPATARVLGYELGDLGEDVLGLIHPDDMRKTAHRSEPGARRSRETATGRICGSGIRMGPGTAIDVWGHQPSSEPRGEWPRHILPRHQRRLGDGRGMGRADDRRTLRRGNIT